MSKIILLENIRSLHNVGAVFRTADGAGWDEVILGGYTGTPPDRRIEKVSLGAEENLTWSHHKNPVEKVKALKQAGYLIVALEQTTQSQNIFETKLNTEKIVLILGNEVEGVSTELLQLTDEHLEIPMYGKKGSLNVSIAAGIALYQLQSA